MQLTGKNSLRAILVSLLGRLVGAAFLVCLLLTFLTLMRLLDAKRLPERTIRMVETLEEMAPPTPPPIEIQESTPPPPPPPPSLPRLEMQIESIAPPVVATLDPRIDLTMRNTEFELDFIPNAEPAPIPVTAPVAAKPSLNTVPKPQVQGPVSVGDLDSRPRLLNRPSTRYPSALLRRGIRSGTVILEVSISMSGRVKVRRVISSSHPELTKMASSFASRARFSAPKKDGKSVEALYRWPMTLQPPN